MKKITATNHTTKETIEINKSKMPPLGCIDNVFGFVKNLWLDGYHVVKISINEDEYILFDKSYGLVKGKIVKKEE